MHTAYSSYEAKLPVTFSADSACVDSCIDACIEPPPELMVTVGEVKISDPTEAPNVASAKPGGKSRKATAKPHGLTSADLDLLDVSTRPMVQTSPYSPSKRSALASRSLAQHRGSYADVIKPAPRAAYRPFPIGGSARGGLLVALSRATTGPSTEERDATTWLRSAIKLIDTMTDAAAHDALVAAMDQGLARGIREANGHIRLNTALADAIEHNGGSKHSQDDLLRLVSRAAYDKLLALRLASAGAVASR